jgi:glycosyltransferase involved in cell wall biosynthesis
MGQTAYKRSRERYSWPALAERVARVYDEVTADAAPTLRRA